MDILEREVSVLKFSFEPFPEIRTENLILRELRINDLQDLYEMRKDPRMNLYVDNTIDQNINETLEYLERMNRGVALGKWIIWGLELKSEVRLIGTISIWNFKKAEVSGELGYGLDFRYHKKGYMTEALKAIIDYSFNTLELKRLLAYTEIRNRSSIALLERCGFKKTGELEEKGIITNLNYVMAIYQLKNKGEI